MGVLSPKVQLNKKVTLKFGEIPTALSPILHKVNLPKHGPWRHVILIQLIGLNHLIDPFFLGMNKPLLLNIKILTQQQLPIHNRPHHLLEDLVLYVNHLEQELNKLGGVGALDLLLLHGHLLLDISDHLLPAVFDVDGEV